MESASKARPAGEVAFRAAVVGCRVDFKADLRSDREEGEVSSPSLNTFIGTALTPRGSFGMSYTAS